MKNNILKKVLIKTIKSLEKLWRKVICFMSFVEINSIFFLNEKVDTSLHFGKITLLLGNK